MNIICKECKKSIEITDCVATLCPHCFTVNYIPDEMFEKYVNKVKKKLKKVNEKLLKKEDEEVLSKKQLLDGRSEHTRLKMRIELFVANAVLKRIEFKEVNPSYCEEEDGS